MSDSVTLQSIGSSEGPALLQAAVLKIVPFEEESIMLLDSTFYSIEDQIRIVHRNRGAQSSNAKRVQLMFVKPKRIKKEHGLGFGTCATEAKINPDDTVTVFWA